MPEQLIAAQIPDVYAVLYRLARSYLRREQGGVTWQPTALVNEAYLRLARQSRRQTLERNELLKAAAGAMRLALVDHSRRRRAAKRQAKLATLVTSEAWEPTPCRLDVLAIDAALKQLERVDPDLARLVTLRFFGGLSEREVAAMLEVSERTVRRSWSIAKAWLRAHLER